MGSHGGVRSLAGRSRGLALAGALGAAALAVGGCGGSSSSNSSPTTAGGTSGATMITLPTVHVAGPKFCSDVVNADQDLLKKLPSAVSAPSEITAFEAEYTTLAGEAPSAIKGAVSDLGGTISRLAGAASNPTAMAQALPGLETRISQDEEAIGTWTGENCTPG